MTKKTVGQVTPEERAEIQTLFERRNGLNELAKILTADNAELYEKLVKDMGETGRKFQNWWDRMAEKYKWESAEGGNWEINFDTCEILLVLA
ncbi:MAG: CXXX repeat peptide modification system protein [Bacteroidaceae bacterium]|nr:CXXX repeat peptide modification system protein [Bacteroidaceae bacterium]